MQYQYVAYTLEDGIISGRMSAHSEADARADLIGQGLKPLRLTRAFQLPSLEKVAPFLYEVKTAELLYLARTISTMLESGANLLRVLEMMHAEAKTRGMKMILTDIHTRVSDGESFSSVLKNHPKVFDEVFVAMAEVGDYTGRLGPALEELASMMARAADAKKKAVSAMVMPMFMISVSMAMLGFMALVMLPPMVENFTKMGAEMPIYTIKLIEWVKWFTGHLTQVGIGIGIVFAANKLAKRSPRIAKMLDLAKARAPVFGGLILASELGRYSRIVGTLLSSGVDLPVALGLRKSASKNEALRQAWQDSTDSLMTGGRMAEALQDHPIVPTMFSELLLIGEESNTLPKQMRDIAEAYEKQFEDSISMILTVGETFSTLAVGGVTLFMAMSVVMPIFDAMGNI